MDRSDRNRAPSSSRRAAPCALSELDARFVRVGRPVPLGPLSWDGILDDADRNGSAPATLQHLELNQALTAEPSTSPGKQPSSDDDIDPHRAASPMSATGQPLLEPITVDEPVAPGAMTD